MDSCAYSSIVFLLIALILKYEFFYIKLILICLTISSSIFHLLDHEIEDIYNLMPYVFIVDLFFIILLSTYILSRSPIISFLFGFISILVLYFNNLENFVLIKNISVILAICYNLLVIYSDSSRNTCILLFILLLITIIALLDNDKVYANDPYHTSWKPTNILIWHLVNLGILYIIFSQHNMLMI